LTHGSADEPNMHDATVSVSKTWVLAFEPSEDWLAVRRRDGREIRGKHHVKTFGTEPPGLSAGAFFVIRREDGLGLTRENGTTVPVKGCSGLLRAAEPRPDGLVIHVAKAVSDGANPDTAADSQLCFVRHDGVTTRILQLGHATCGLAGPLPCEWRLTAASGGLFGFGSLRGQTKLVDVINGKEVGLAPRPLPDGSELEGYADCSGGEVCLVYGKAEDRSETLVAVRVSGGLVSLGQPMPVDESRWCLPPITELPVPREVCDFTNNP